MPPSCAVFGGFAIGAQAALLYGNITRTRYKLASIPRYVIVWTLCGVCARCWPVTGRRRGGVLNITAAAWTAGFHWRRSGNITRTQNVSEYMLVLALCLVEYRVNGCVRNKTRSVEVGHPKNHAKLVHAFWRWDVGASFSATLYIAYSIHGRIAYGMSISIASLSGGRCLFRQSFCLAPPSGPEYAIVTNRDRLTWLWSTQSDRM